MNKLLAGTVTAGMLSSAALFGNGVAAADTALIVPETAPPAFPALRSLYHFKSSMDPQIGENYFNPASARVVVPYPASAWPITGMNSLTVGQSVTVGANKPRLGDSPDQRPHLRSRTVAGNPGPRPRTGTAGD